jgi:SpoVK/Ycf46/Vps4 family AAA+-type ATPase
MENPNVYSKCIQLNKIAIKYENDGNFGGAIVKYYELGFYLFELLNRFFAQKTLTQNIYKTIAYTLARINQRCHELDDLTRHGQHLGAIQDIFTNISTILPQQQQQQRVNIMDLQELPEGLTLTQPYEQSTFVNIIGHNNVKIEIQKILNILINTNPVVEQLKNEMHLTNTNILFYGPPGTGKTSLANAIAHQLQWPMFVVKLGNLFSAYVGETEKRVENIFSWLLQQKKILLFIDEIESLLGERRANEENYEMRIKDSFLTSIDDLNKQNNDIIIIGATNLLFIVDEACRRRFSYIIHVPLPNLLEIIELFQFYLHKINHTLNENDLLQPFPNKFNNYISHSDIANLCKKYEFEYLNYIQIQIQNNQIKYQILPSAKKCDNYKRVTIESTAELGGNQQMPFEKEIFDQICVNFSIDSFKIISDLKDIIEQKMSINNHE